MTNERKRQTVVALILVLTLLLSPKWKLLNNANSFLLKFAPWKIGLAGYTLHYVLSHSLSLVGLGSPDLPEHHYRKNFRNLRRILTGLDAGIISSLNVNPKWFRNIISIILGVYFIIFSKKAEDRMHRFHQNATIKGIRACWQKGRHPLLWKIAQLKQPTTIKIHRKKINNIKRKDNTDIDCYLYFQGTLEQLKNARHIVLNFPGGGFVAMNHKHHESYMRKWANYLRIPIVAVNYRKAPEYQYPNGFNDAYNVYKSIVETNGSIIGIECESKSNDKSNGKSNIKICLTGDSAGGNLVAAVCCRAITENIKIPNGLLMAYPMLDCDMSLYRATNYKNDFRRNMTHAITYHSYLPEASDIRKDLLRENDEQNILHYMDDETRAQILSEIEEINIDDSVKSELTDLETQTLDNNNNGNGNSNGKTLEEEEFSVRIRRGPFSSRAEFFDDGVLPIKYLLVLGEAIIPTHADPVNDMFLSPLHAPVDVLSKFPDCRIHVGSVDPLVDDSRRFVQKLKYANPDIHVKLLEWEGLSHAYIQSPTFLLPQARYSCELTVHWLSDMLGIDVIGKESFAYDLKEADRKSEYNNNSRKIKAKM